MLRAHERGRRARPLHSRFRPDRRDDAVQHVSPLHGRRAPAPRRRRPGRYRARPARRRASAVDRDLAADQQPHGALCRAVPARHRQGPRRRIIRSPARESPRKLGPAPRPVAGRDRDGRLADRAPSGHVQYRAEPRSVRPARRSELRQHGADAGAPAAAARADRRGHPRGRARASGTAGRASCCARSTGRPKSCSPAAIPPIDRKRARRPAQEDLRTGLPGWTDAGVRRLCRAPLSGLLAQGRSRRTRSSMPICCGATEAGRVRSRPKSRPMPSAA